VTAPEDRRAYDAVMNCNRCGFCTSFCPTYLATGDEGLSPRGRNQTFRALLEGRLPAREAAKAFDSCLLCGICTSVCFAEVPTARLMSAARGKSKETAGRSPGVLLFLRFLLPRPAFFEGFLKLLYGPKRLGLSGLLNRIGFLRLLSPQLAAAEAMVDEVPRKFLRDLLPPAPVDADIVQFLACGPNVLRPPVGLATARLLARAGARAGAAANVCCGLPGLSFGDREAARALARKNIEILERTPRATVLVDDSSCAATIKEYPLLFEEDPAWKTRAKDLVRRTKDLLEWLVENPPSVPLSKRGVGGDFVVTYHDACKARYGQGLVDQPRRILSSVPGVEYRELAEADQCCGGGGTYSFTQPEVSRAVGARKADHVAATGAEAVLTSSVSCLLQLRAGLRRAGSDIGALHIAEFLVTDKDLL